MQGQSTTKSIAWMLGEVERLVTSVRAQLGLGQQTGTTTTTTVARATNGTAPTPGTARGRRRPRKRLAELSSWRYTKQARRLPNFVMEATGYKTVKELAGKYPMGSRFEKGKPLPAAIAAAPATRTSRRTAEPAQATAH